MKTLLLVMAALSLTGCARVWIKQDMQADHSYKVEADGNGYATLEDVHMAANGRASLLCPKGFETNASIPEDAFKPSYTLMVSCK